MYIKTNRGYESFATGFQSDTLRNVVDMWENTPDEDFAQVLGENLFEDIKETAVTNEEEEAQEQADYDDIPIEEVPRTDPMNEIPIEGYRSPEGAALLYARAAYEMADLAFHADSRHHPEPDLNMLKVCDDATSGPVAEWKADLPPQTETCLGAVVQLDGRENIIIDAMRSGDFDQIAASRLAHGVGMTTPLVTEIAATQPSVAEAHEKLNRLFTKADRIAGKPEATAINKFRRISDLISNAPDDLTFASGDTIPIAPLRDYADKQVNQAQKKTSLLKTHAAHDPQADNSIDLGF